MIAIKSKQHYNYIQKKSPKIIWQKSLNELSDKSKTNEKPR